MTTKYRGFIIEVLANPDEYVVTVTKQDGSIFKHDLNPDYFTTEKDAEDHGKCVINDILDN